MFQFFFELIYSYWVNPTFCFWPIPFCDQFTRGHSRDPHSRDPGQHSLRQPNSLFGNTNDFLCSKAGLHNCHYLGGKAAGHVQSCILATTQQTISSCFAMHRGRRGHEGRLLSREDPCSTRNNISWDSSRCRRRRGIYLRNQSCTSGNHTACLDSELPSRDPGIGPTPLPSYLWQISTEMKQ